MGDTFVATKPLSVVPVEVPRVVLVLAEAALVAAVVRVDSVEEAAEAVASPMVPEAEAEAVASVEVAEATAMIAVAAEAAVAVAAAREAVATIVVVEAEEAPVRALKKAAEAVGNSGTTGTSSPSHHWHGGDQPRRFQLCTTIVHVHTKKYMLVQPNRPVKAGPQARLEAPTGGH